MVTAVVTFYLQLQNAFGPRRKWSRWMCTVVQPIAPGLLYSAQIPPGKKAMEKITARRICLKIQTLKFSKFFAKLDEMDKENLGKNNNFDWRILLTLNKISEKVN